MIITRPAGRNDPRQLIQLTGIILVTQEGLEPSATGLKGRCSTD